MRLSITLEELVKFFLVSVCSCRTNSTILKLKALVLEDLFPETKLLLQAYLSLPGDNKTQKTQHKCCHSCNSHFDSTEVLSPRYASGVDPKFSVTELA